MIELFLSAVFTFTAPGLDSGPGCSTSSSPCGDLAAYVLKRHRQSPTWVTNASAFRAEYDAGSRVWSAALSATWSTVHQEAEWSVFATFPANPGDAGRLVTLTIPDTTATGWFYAVAVRDTAGNESCMSNEVAR